MRAYFPGVAQTLQLKVAGLKGYKVKHIYGNKIKNKIQQALKYNIGVKKHMMINM